jgi:outer membrane receptor protein involved in Fe transport
VERFINEPLGGLMMKTGSITSLNRKKLARAVAMALAIPAAGLSAAYAQEGPAASQTQQQGQLEQITVTGSRIVRRDYSANSPIQTVDRDTLDSQASIGLESALDQLPQFVPAATELTQMQDQSQLTDNFPTKTAGASLISLRGLGPNRNLVLLDGYRAVPVNATMAVDINSIPSAAIERVETITGGASSVYGADAVAGVVNFITRKDFEGVNIDAQYGNVQNGEGPQTRVSALFGMNSPDGKGNVMLGIERAKREPLAAIDTDFYNHAMHDPLSGGGTEFIHTDPSFAIDRNNPPDGAVIDQIFDGAPPGVVLRSTPNGPITGGVSWNNDGTVYTGAASFNGTSPTGPGATEGVYRYNGLYNVVAGNANLPGNYPWRHIDAQGQIQQEIPYQTANVPLDRTSVFGRAQYDLSDRVTAYTQFLGVESSTERLWSMSPMTGGWGMSIPHGSQIYGPSLNQDGTTNGNYLPGGRYGLDCPSTGGCTMSQVWPVSPELDQLLNSRANPDAPWTFNYGLDFSDWGIPGYERAIFSTTRTTQLNFGLKGDLPGIDGTWDVVASKGATKLDMSYSGYASLTRTRTIFQSPNFGQGFFQQANPEGGGFAGGIATCTSGMPVFRNHSQISQDCLDAIFVTAQHQSEMDQDFIEANVQGHLVNMPAGEARFSVGTTTRSYDYYYYFDPMQQEGSFNDNLLGFPADNSQGSTSVNEVYGELLLPMLNDKAGAEHLNLELGYRYSDYEQQGGVDTWKALIDWGITPTLRFRGGKQLATRAPDIAEMFQAQTQSWYVSGTGDPCGLNSNAPYGVNASVNPNYQQALSICKARMGAVGADTFYDPSTRQPNGFSWTPFVNATGNPNVDPETATTWTAGFVWQPQSGREKLDGLNLTVDYYSIDLKDMISVEPAEVVYEQCLSVASNPAGDPNTPACQSVFRNPTGGGAAPTTVTYINAAFAKVEGVDFTANWQTDLANGNFGINFMITKLLTEETQATPDAPVIDWKGSLGPTPGTSLTNGAYDYRTFTNFSYRRNAWNLAMRWRHLPSAVAATAAVTPLTTDLGAQESYDVFDLTGSWNAASNTTVRFGIENLFDTPPVWTGGRSAADPHPTNGSSTTEAGFYDILGRQYYIGVALSF